MQEEKGSTIGTNCLIQEENSNKIWELLNINMAQVTTIQKTLEKANIISLQQWEIEKHSHSQGQVKLLGAPFTQESQIL